MSVLMSHKQFEDENPDHLAYAVDAARRISLQGGEPTREFPCPGSLLEVEQIGGLVIVQCDVCFFEVGYKCRPRPPEERLAQSGLPMAMLARELIPHPDATLAGDMLRRWADGWSGDQRVNPPLLVGKPGRGKTHLLTLTACTLVQENGVAVRYWPIAALLNEVRRSYDETGGCDEWEHALDVELLVLDDLGAENLTDWSREQFTTLLDHRYRHGLPLLSATNIATGDWADVFGARAASRLAAMTAPVAVGGPDWRQGTFI